MTAFRDSSPGYLINDLARQFANALQARIRPLGLSTGVFPVLVHLWEQDGLTQSDLVARVGVEQATMANTLARMQRDGLVTRRRDDQDGRIQRNWLTEHAKLLREPAIAAAGEVNRTALSGLSAAERAQFVALLGKAIDTFGASTPDG
jgi:DNA-binding MarR family transcriptional regulator